VAQKNAQRRWFHVPLMTTSPVSRREPYHGVTKERALRSGDHTWILDGTGGSNNLQAVAIGYYNWLGGYTIGQVFKDPDPTLSEPTATVFINGAFVFKLLFAEFDPVKIDSALNPLDGAPEWQVQDVQAATGPLLNVRLLQLDVAVKDPRSTQTGWVFATYVYDKSLTSTEPNPWKRLTAVGLQWGNDPDVTGPGVGTIDESWINPGLPAVFHHQGTTSAVGRDGRLNGPVDNPASSCISCHSTAQVLVGGSNLDAFRGVDLVPPGPCSNAEDMTWFRNVMGGLPFGVTTNGGTGCGLETPQPSTPPLSSLDYSLQIAVALESALFFENPNPCQTMATSLRASSAPKPIGNERQRPEVSRSTLPDRRRIEVTSDAVMKARQGLDSRHDR
jgi:hypothetical protein